MSETQEAFRPGIYRHYKGGMYTALMLVKHHETRAPYVLYISHTYGGPNIRPLVPVPGDPDGWLDNVEHEGKTTRRFMFVGDPGDTAIMRALEKAPEWCANCPFAKAFHYEGRGGELITPSCSGYVPKSSAKAE